MLAHHPSRKQNKLVPTENCCDKLHGMPSFSKIFSPNYLASSFHPLTNTRTPLPSLIYRRHRYLCVEEFYERANRKCQVLNPFTLLSQQSFWGRFWKGERKIRPVGRHGTRILDAACMWLNSSTSRRRSFQKVTMKTCKFWKGGTNGQRSGGSKIIPAQTAFISPKGNMFQNKNWPWP